MPQEPSTQTIDFDLLVIGAGMAGLSAGSLAAESGARVLVVEKANEIGGSARQAGYLWTVPDPRILRGWDDGDPQLGTVVVENYAAGVAWMRSRDMIQSKVESVLHGRGYALNVIGHMRQCVTDIQSAGGFVALETHAQRLIIDDAGHVAGARFIQSGEEIEVRARWTLLATGGFQANPELREQRIHPSARHIAVRSNPNSSGDGVRLGLEAGATWAGDNAGFYGHLISSPRAIQWSAPSTFIRLAQYQSDYGLLFNEAGKRFTDESQGDFRNSNMLVFEANARGLLVWDEHVQSERVLTPRHPGSEVYCKLNEALAHGAHGARSMSVQALAATITPWGFDGAAVAHSIETYNRDVTERPETLRPPRAFDLRALDRPPYYALVVEPAITFTHDGLRIDASARALDCDGHPIDGLLVAGADAGNIYKFGYAGGLAAALGFAIQAVRTAGWARMTT